MAQAQAGDTVRVHYTGRLGDGTVFDSSQGSDPLEFTLGEGQVIAGFDRAVTGMSPGDSQTVTIPVNDAYGERREEMVQTVGREQFPSHVEPEVGQRFQVTNGQQMAVVTVTEVSADGVTLDGNHPLAGEELTFELSLVEIV